MKKTTELTPKQEAQRTRDCAVKYGRAESYPGITAKVEGLVQEKWEARLNAERLALWTPEDDVAALPAWEPRLSPAVARVVGASTAEVAKFMTTVSRTERTAIVKKIVKALAPEDPELAESLVWRHLFDLQKEQGVNLMADIKKAL